MPGGRPSKYTNKLTDKICTRLAVGESLRSICKDAKMPAMSTVMLWLQEREEFSEQYARARDAQAETHADEIIYIADNEEDINRAKVKIDARRWTASKLKPKKYGNFQHIEHSGNIDSKAARTMTDNELDRAIEAARQRLSGVVAGKEKTKAGKKQRRSLH